MFEKERNYPSAVTAGPEHGDRGLKDGLTWLVNRVSELGGQPLVFAPGMSNVRDVPLLEQFTKVQGVAVGTWRGIRDWHGGPVLAVWPNRVKLGEIADDRRTTALCVVPWVSGELDAWQAAADPEVLGLAVARIVTSTLDPVVIEGLKTLTAMVNHSNNLAGSLDRRDAVAVLRTLKKAGNALPASDVYAWSIANGWPTRGAERLRILASDFEAGKRPQMKGEFPFRADILDTWRAKAGKS
jgi:hypothetical protein